jgi:membrane protein
VSEQRSGTGTAGGAVDALPTAPAGATRATGTRRRSARPPRRHAARRLVERTLTGAWNDDIFSESAAAAFWQTLSLPPLLLGLFGVLGYTNGIAGADTAREVEVWTLDLARGIFSRQAMEEIVTPTVEEVLTSASAGIISVSFLLSLWSGSSAMAAFVDAITRAHRQYEVRNLVWQRVLAILMYVVGLVTGVIALPLLILGPDRLIPLLPDGVESVTTTLVETLYYPVIGVVLLLALTTMYKVALPLKPPWYRGLPGAALAVLAFFAASTCLRIYLNSLTAVGFTYGALAAPIAFLLVTFAIGLAVILGAHLNAAVQALWPVPLTDRRRRLERSGPGTPALRRLVQEEPDAAAAVLEQLAYEVRPPADRRDPG